MILCIGGTSSYDDFTRFISTNVCRTEWRTVGNQEWLVMLIAEYDRILVYTQALDMSYSTIGLVPYMYDINSYFTSREMYCKENS